jgi:hypothetical protein
MIVDSLLDKDLIQDVVTNLEGQLEYSPSEDQLFKAFVFYIENDAFIVLGDAQ